METRQADSSIKPSRRSVLVMMGAVLLGRFSLPELDQSDKPLDAPESELGDELVRRLLHPPIWGNHSGIRFLFWTEEGSDHKVEFRIWKPETDDELAEAVRFVEVAAWRSWTTPSELRGLLRRPGPWLVRWNLMGRFSFLRSVDRTRLFSPGWKEDETLLTIDPSEAARVSSEQSEQLILELTEKWELGEGVAYLEPVLPEDAFKEFRNVRG